METEDRSRDVENHAFSDELEVSLDDELGWKDHLTHFNACDYEVPLVLIPDEDVVATLRRHLDACAIEIDEKSFPTLLHEIVWLKMQIERPNLYSRMVALERGQAAQAGEALEIRQWFHAQYRDLLLLAARQLVLDYKKHPALHNDEDFEDDLWTGFGNWHDTAASLDGNASAFLSTQEVISFLRDADFSSRQTARFFQEHKSHLPQEIPEYHAE